MNSRGAHLASVVMQYRILNYDEWNRLTDLIPPEFLPLPETATAAVAEDDKGEIQGVLFLQLQLHMEPLLIRSAGVNFMRLQETLHKAVAHQKGLVYFVFTSSPKIAGMAKRVGMELLDYQVWRKEVV